MFSFGRSSRRALTTVRPPIPESKTPIGFIDLIYPQSWRQPLPSYGSLGIYAEFLLLQRAYLRKVAVCDECRKLKWQAHYDLRFVDSQARRLRYFIRMAELSKTYDPKTVEPKWYQRWLNAEAFRAD